MTRNADRLRRGWPGVFWCAGLGLGGLQFWAAVRSDSMNADGVAYLDLADAWFSGSWQAAVNSVWSPLYSWVLGVALRLFRPAPQSEFALVHAVNFVLFIFALVCFEFLRREMVHDAGDRLMADGPTRRTWPWLVVPHLVFLWASLCLVTIWAVTPDMLMAALVCVAAGLIVRIRRGQAGPGTAVLLGIALGLGYLAKSVMFPLGFTFIAAAALAEDNRRRVRIIAIPAATAFLLVCVPWITLISRAQDRFTFGDAGRVTYLRYVNEIPHPYWPSGSEPVGGTMPVHPARQVLAEPAVFEFAGPVRGTYPISYDPAYWHAGLRAHWNPGQQSAAVLRNTAFYLELFGRHMGAPLACVLLALMASGRRQKQRWPGARRAVLLLPVVSALGLYALVYVESMYVGVFVLLLWMEILFNLPRPRPAGARLSGLAGILAVLFLTGNVAAFYLRGADALRLRARVPATAATRPAPRVAEVAAALTDLGVRPGDPVGVIGYAFDSFWARVAKLRIIAEMPIEEAPPFWHDTADVRHRVLTAFADAGARVIVAEQVPASVQLQGWRQVGQSSFFIRLTDGTSSPPVKSVFQARLR